MCCQTLAYCQLVCPTRIGIGLCCSSPLCCRSLVLAGWKMEKGGKDGDPPPRHRRRQSIWLHSAVEAGSCRVSALSAPCHQLKAFPSHFQLLEASLTSAEECREGVSPFLRAWRGGFQSSALLLWHSPLRLVYALRWSYSRDRQHMAEKFLLYTHTHDVI